MLLKAKYSSIIFIPRLKLNSLFFYQVYFCIEFEEFVFCHVVEVLLNKLSFKPQKSSEDMETTLHQIIFKLYGINLSKNKTLHDQISLKYFYLCAYLASSLAGNTCKTSYND